jgi:hypothetical protein
VIEMKTTKLKKVKSSKIKDWRRVAHSKAMVAFFKLYRECWNPKITKENKIKIEARIVRLKEIMAYCELRGR